MRPIPPEERGKRKAGKPRPIQPDERGIRRQWWTAPPGEVAHDMVAIARRIANRQAYLRDQHLYFARMHGGVQIAALSPTAYSRPIVNTQDGFTIGLNVIENICSSAQAELCQNKPKATFSTDAGDFYKQQEAEKLTRWLEAQFYACKFYDIAPAVALDGLIFGTGVLKIYENELTEEIAIERVFPWELFIDQAEGLYGTPLTIYQTKYVDRFVLAETYPEHEQKIMELSSQPLGMGRDPFMWDTTADLVQVVEAWRLPSGKDTGDGRHVIAVGDLCILDEPWEREDFPFAFFRWRKRPFGFWGMGVCEQLAGIQKEINRLVIKIQRAFARLGITRIYVERGSKVNPAHLRSNDGDIVEYTGQKPVTEAPASVNPEIFSHLWQLVQQAYKLTGVAEMTAQGAAPPPGVDSGRAIRTLLANHSKRMMVVIDDYVEMAMQAGQKMIALAHDIAQREIDSDEEDEETGEKKKKSRGYVVSWTDDSGTEQIDFSEIDLSEDDYIMRPYPTSVLPSNPGEKMQVVQEWFNTGMIDGDRAMMLMDFPDTKAFADMNPAIAEYREVMFKLNGILKDGKAWVPDGFIDPGKAKALAVPFLLNAERRNAPEGRLDLLRQSIEDLVTLEKGLTPNAQQVAQQGQKPGAAPAAPGQNPQLPTPTPGPQPSQVAPMGQMANPLKPAA